MKIVNKIFNTIKKQKVLDIVNEDMDRWKKELTSGEIKEERKKTLKRLITLCNRISKKIEHAK